MQCNAETLFVSAVQYRVKPDGRFIAVAVIKGLGREDFNLKLEADGRKDFEKTGSENWVLRACLFPAMQFCKRIYIKGRVDRDLIVSMAELNAVWNAWRPDKYKIIEIGADEIVDSPDDFPQRSGMHLLAYSGGVDAMSALIRHGKQQLGWRSREIGAALLVHGFDIPLSDEHSFEVANRSAEKVLDFLGIPVIKLRTNLRSLPLDWGDAFGLSLSAVASFLGSQYSGLVYGADSRDYVAPMIPWGSNPVGDRFFGSRRFECYADGCEISRAEKIAQIAQSPELARHLRVCWQNGSAGGNCCSCEKCLRTQMMFLAQRLSIPPCFAIDFNPNDLRKISLANAAQEKSMADILALAAANRIRDVWVGELRCLIRRERKRRFPNLVKRIMKRINAEFNGMSR